MRKSAGVWTSRRRFRPNPTRAEKKTVKTLTLGSNRMLSLSGAMPALSGAGFPTQQAT
jgi:hypothetical protein